MDAHRSPRPLLPLLLATAMLAGACGGGDGETGAPSGTREVALPTSPSALPTFDLAAFRALLAELHGKPVVVNFWASWCGPCEEEAPALARIARAFDRRVQFLGVDILDVRPQARAFIRRFGWPYPSIFDPDAEIRDGLGFLGQPVTVIYDAAGRQAFVWSGAVPEKVLTSEIRAVLKP